MKINPINSGTQTQTTNFKSKIVKNDFLEAGYKLANESIETGMLKDLNKVKNFYDSLNKIKASKAAETVSFERVSEGAVVVADGKRTLLMDKQNKNFQPGYIAVKAVSLYAQTLEQPAEKTVLDSCQQNILEVMDKLGALEQNYATHLKDMLENIKKS